MVHDTPEFFDGDDLRAETGCTLPSWATEYARMHDPSQRVVIIPEGARGRGITAMVAVLGDPRRRNYQ